MQSSNSPKYKKLQELGLPNFKKQRIGKAAKKKVAKEKSKGVKYREEINRKEIRAVKKIITPVKAKLAKNTCTLIKKRQF